MLMPVSVATADSSKESNSPLDTLNDILNVFGKDGRVLSQLQREGHDSLALRPQNAEFVHGLQDSFQQTSGVSVAWKMLPEETTYNDFLVNMRTACNQKQTGLYDVVWLDATALAEVGDCLANVLDWDSKIADGHDPNILNNYVVNGTHLGRPLLQVPVITH
jgi:hypothetical protein